MAICRTVRLIPCVYGADTGGCTCAPSVSLLRRLDCLALSTPRYQTSSMRPRIGLRSPRSFCGNSHCSYASRSTISNNHSNGRLSITSTAIPCERRATPLYPFAVISFLRSFTARPSYSQTLVPLPPTLSGQAINKVPTSFVISSKRINFLGTN